MFDSKSGKLKILLIEDEGRWRDTFRSIVEEDTVLIMVSNSDEALVELEQHSNIDLVIIDHRLDERDQFWGLDLCTKIRKRNQKIKIVMWSVTNTFRLRALTKEEGCNGFIDKINYADGKAIFNSLKKLVYNNQEWIEIPESKARSYSLNKRETEIISYIAEGYNQEWIARKEVHAIFKGDFQRYYTEFKDFFRGGDKENPKLNGAFEAFCRSTNPGRKPRGPDDIDLPPNDKKESKVKTRLDASRHVLNNQIKALKEKLMGMFPKETDKNPSGEMHLFELAQLAYKEFRIPVNERERYFNFLVRILDFHIAKYREKDFADKLIEYFIFDELERIFKKEKIKKWLIDIKIYQGELPIDKVIEKHNFTREKLFEYIRSDDFLKGL